MRARPIALLLLPTVLGACVATTTSSRTWGGPDAGWARYGHVESIRETVRRQQGDPAAGAVAGAIIGGFLGSAMTGNGNPAGTVAGAVGGAMVGAAASQGSAEDRLYEVYVRFDDGALESFAYQGALPFAVGDRVALTQQGLARM